jgi:hypothetical protein
METLEGGQSVGGGGGGADKTNNDEGACWEVIESINRINVKRKLKNEKLFG